jgi:hypothetical protein
MTINIKVFKNKKQPDALRIKVDTSRGSKMVEVLDLQARRNLKGDVMIFDHNDIDIVVTKDSRIIAFAKDMFGEAIYETQNRLFKYLFEKGIIEYKSLQGGAFYASVEATILESKDYKPIPHALYVIAKFMKKERPQIDFEVNFEKEQENRLSEPLPGEYTEFDPAKYHDDKKGSIQPGHMPFGISAATTYRSE